MGPIPELTAGQRMFAETHRASGFMPARGRSDGSVFVYRFGEDWTDRWHVSPDGHRLDWQLLHRGRTTAREH